MASLEHLLVVLALDLGLVDHKLLRAHEQWSIKALCICGIVVLLYIATDIAIVVAPGVKHARYMPALHQLHI